MPAGKRLVAAPAVLLLLAWQPGAAEVDLRGHVKARGLADDLPSNSVFRGIAGSSAVTAESEFRLILAATGGAWSLDLDYQAFGIFGDALDIARERALAQGPATVGVLDDARRWFDLTHTISDASDGLLIHRLDRVALTWSSDRSVVRFGRQALTWGGGLFFSPFDIVNPFDPAAVDTEYKTGDDMLYAQYLQSSGNDLQAAWVRRRDPVTGRLSSDESTLAFKYHGVAGEAEYDLLFADNRGRTTLGLGGNLGIAGAVVRADLVLADGADWTAEALVNLSYSWTALGKNVTGAVEYFYNGWGLADGPYDLLDIAADTELAERLARGETFTIGRHYLTAGATIELTPLWLLTPNVFFAIDDPSALLQVVVNRSLGDNLTFLGAVNVPLGPDGSEFGGIAAGMEYLSRGAGLFAQLAWYF